MKVYVYSINNDMKVIKLNGTYKGSSHMIAKVSAKTHRKIKKAWKRSKDYFISKEEILWLWN